MSKNKIFSYDVIIIGAGIAGITAAKLFDKNNVSNILIEADNRVGGRAKFAEASFGSWFDLGCSYLHEGDINPFTKIAKNLNIPISHKKGDFFSIEKTNYFFNKKNFSKHKISLLKNSFNDLKRNICRYVEINEDISLSQCLNKDDPNNILITNYLTGLNAIEPNFLSTIDFASVNEGKDLIIETGLAKMIKSWACGINAEINNPVNKIKWGKDLIEVHTKSKKYISKTVLITVSTGILKNQDITFIPNLPKYKIQAINNLPMGILNKIGVLFKEGTFSDKDIGWYVACEGKDDENVSNIFNFEIRKKEKEHMIFFMGGKEGLKVENFPKKYYKIVENFIEINFGKEIKDNIIKYIHSSWGKDPFSRGSYSFSCPGHSLKRVLLKKPLAKKLYFAGEATINNYYGTCHGAYISGINAAKEIILKLKN